MINRYPIRASTKLVFRKDNPGGDWLKHKKEDNEYHKKTDFGVPSRIGTVTGSFNRPVLMPVSVMRLVPGMRGEQTRVREDDLSSLVKIMGETDKLPVANGKQYAPFMAIDQTGSPWMNEGNHRIMAAVKLGWKYIPVEVRYFTGGEDETKVLSPQKLLSYDKEAHEEGYEDGELFRGIQKVK